jgi:carbon-monoxide dehydrogenase large subunit
VSGGDVDAAFKNAEVVVKDRIVQQRLIPTAIETRSALAQYLPATGELTSEHDDAELRTSCASPRRS